jgi:hypothetical protein
MSMIATCAFLCGVLAIERALQNPIALSNEALRDICVGCQTFEAMVYPWIHVQFGGNSCLKKPSSVFNVLVQEQIEFTHDDVCRRQTCQVGSPRRRCIERHVLPCVGYLSHPLNLAEKIGVG